MTNEEINEAIALQLGWAKCACGDIRCGAWFPPGTSDPYKAELGVPSFCKDLNALREALNTLTDDESWRLILHLSDITRNEHHGDPDDWFNRSTDWTWRVVNATAHQRSEAFLRTLGKWKEDKL